MASCTIRAVGRKPPRCSTEALRGGTPGPPAAGPVGGRHADLFAVPPDAGRSDAELSLADLHRGDPPRSLEKLRSRPALVATVPDLPGPASARRFRPILSAGCAGLDDTM